MPKVFDENGYKFFFFSNEGIPIEPCHIHVRKNSSLAKFWIKETAMLASSYGFSAEELNYIESVINKNLNRIKEAWNEFFF